MIRFLADARSFGEFVQASGYSPGVLLVKQSSPIAEVIDELVLIWSATNAAEWRNRILRIPADVTLRL